MNYEIITELIKSVIKKNGRKEINGEVLQQTFLALIHSLGSGYQFVGLAQLNTDPGTPDARVFYVATSTGVYEHFGGLELSKGQIGIFMFSNEWTSIVFDTVTLYAEITHGDLLGLVNGGNLVPGQKYRITDYVASVSPPAPGEFHVIAVSRPFDIIVTALSENLLSEDARAVPHPDTDYFGPGVYLWKLKYCIFNDSSRFDWASNTGKGVIYEMTDEFDNTCPYDFKGILFETRLANGLYSINGDPTYVYTFNVLDHDSGDCLDMSVIAAKGIYKNAQRNEIVTCRGNKVEPSFQGNKQKLKDNVFLQTLLNYEQRQSSVDGWQECDNNTVAAGASKNVFSGSYSGNTIGQYSFSNILGQKTAQIHIGASSNANEFETACKKINLGEYCFDNYFYGGCSEIKLGNSSYGSTFRNGCSQIEAGRGLLECSFGAGCRNITIGNGGDSLHIGANCRQIRCGDIMGLNCGDNCSDITIGNDSYLDLGSNVSCVSAANGVIVDIGDNSADITLDPSVDTTTIGQNCSNIRIGATSNGVEIRNNCHGIDIAPNCGDITIGQLSGAISIGTGCDEVVTPYRGYNIHIGNGCSSVLIYNGPDDEEVYRAANITIGEGCSGIMLYCEDPDGDSQPMQNIRIANGTALDIGTTNCVVPTRGNTFETYFAIDSNGKLQRYCLADNTSILISNDLIDTLLSNEMQSKLENASVVLYDGKKFFRNDVLGAEISRGASTYAVMVFASSVYYDNGDVDIVEALYVDGGRYLRFFAI